MLDTFADGVYFVPLASVTDPDLVPSAIAQALDVPRSTRAADRRVDRRRAAPEAAAAGAGQLRAGSRRRADRGELLGAAARLKILVTSRAALRLYGEREYPVPPLALPDRRTAPSAAHLAQFEAVHLFVDRAQAARPDFALDDENAADVAEICHRLDGLPLAIELAAARIRALPPRAMLQRMERRLPLLTGGARDLPARQRTLRDAIAWSYDLLEPDEQTLFRRLAVFRGCTLESAETVCAGDSPVARSRRQSRCRRWTVDVLDGMESLVEKSLLRQDQAADGQPWYRMLETDPRVRAGAAGRERRGRRRPPTPRARRAAAGRGVRARAVRGEQAAWFARLEQEHDNLRVGAALVRGAGYAEPALRLAVALWWFWSAHGHVKEGRERLDSLLARFPPKGVESASSARARVRSGSPACSPRCRATSHVRAPCTRRALALRRAVGDPLAVIATRSRDSARSPAFRATTSPRARTLEEALAIAREHGDDFAMACDGARTPGQRAERARRAGSRPGLLRAVNAQLPTARRVHGTEVGPLSLALIALDQGDYDEAEALAH